MQLKRHDLITAIVAILVVHTACFGQTVNLVTNRGFEKADSKNADRPAGFEPGHVGNHEVTMTWESPGYRSKRCVAVETKDSSGLGYWQTIVPVKPLTVYTISLRYKTKFTRSGGASAGEAIYNQGRPGGPNLELGMLPDNPADAGKATAWSDIGIALPPMGGLFLPPATAWSSFSHTLTTRENQTKLIVKMRLWCYAQKVWFDDLSVVEGKIVAPQPKPDPLWIAGDTTPPSVFKPQPVPNGNASPDTTIRATFNETGTGIDVGSAKVMLDGKDVTAKATIDADGMTLAPGAPLARGAHRVEVRIADKAGNQGNTLYWQFGVGKTLHNTSRIGASSFELNGKPFFPIGIYAYACHPDDGRFREDHLEQAAAAGYNIVFNTIEKRKGLDMELAHGIMGTLNITPGLKNCTDPASAKKAMLEDGQGKFADHPSVVAFWADDPENVENTEATPVSKTALAKMDHARTVLTQNYPDIPSIFAISNLPRLRPAMPYCDILLSYRYAVPQYHPMMIYGFTIATCQQWVKDKPVWFLSQAVDLGYGPKFKSQEKMRPTPQEIRAMAFYSLVCGIDGYSIYANYLNAENYPEHWQVTLDIAQQMRQIAPALVEGKAAKIARIKKATSSSSIFFRELVFDGVHTVISVNMSAGRIPVQWRFRVPVKAVVLYEDRAMSNTSKSIDDMFEPWGVHIYQWN